MKRPLLMAVGNEPGNQMHDKIDGTAMASMLNLRNILELVENGYFCPTP